MLPLLLLIPVTAAAFAPPADELDTFGSPMRSEVLHPISRMIEDSPEWQVVARFEDTLRGDWSLVIWHDGPQRTGEIDPCELLVLSQVTVADALVATSLCRHAGPCDPMSLAAACDPAFLREVRRDIRYCATVVAPAEDEDSVTRTSTMLVERVRELDKTGVLLTSTLD